MSAVNETAAVPISSAVGEDMNNDVVATTTENNTAIKSTTDTANNNNNIIRRDPQFDHTSRKVVIHNMLKYIRPKEITKLTAQWLSNIPPSEISIVKTKKPPKDSWMKVTLQTEEMVPKFIKLINEGGVDGKAMENGRGKPLFAKRADEMFTNQEGDDIKMSTEDDGDNRKRKNNTTNNTNKRMRPDNRPPIKILSNDEVRDKITPLWRMSYEEQLNSKAKEMVNKCSKKIIKEIKGKFRTLEREAKRDKNRPLIKLYDWVAQPRAIEMEQVVPSPLMYEYRNKCEFTVGYRLVDDSVKEEMKKEEVKKEEVQISEEKEAEEDWVMVDGNVKTEEASDSAKDASSEEETSPPPAQPKVFQKVPAVGFLAQGWAGGVYSPHTLQNMPNWSCGLADIFNNFISTSKIPPYDTKLHRGLWRTITLRCSLRTKECMVIVLHAPAKGGAGAKEDGSDDYSSVFEHEKQRLVNMLTKDVIPTPTRVFPENHDYGKMKKQSNGEGEEGIRVTSIYFQEFDGLSNPKPEHPVQHVYGKDCLEEKLGKCTFQISPGAFFQVNTEGAEILYNIVLDRIREVTDKPQQTLLLDVCCGTGTIGLTMLKEGVVGKLVGVDISKPAIQDAKINATKNGYTDEATTKFIAGPAEKELPSATHELQKDLPIVAVVDPARDGLHGNVIKTLKANEKIQRLVYVSCNPTATLTRDAGMLCSPPTKKYPGRPFKITKSQPVDMFPLTNHCEMVMTFDRMSKEEFDMYHGVSKGEKASGKAEDAKPATNSKEEEHKEEVEKEVN